MNRVLRVSVYAFCFGINFCAQSVAVFGKGKEDASNVNTASSSTAALSEFQWNEHHKLSWDDFRGPVVAETDQSAAATHCGIGLKTNQSVPGGKPDVIVYNKFYANKSWVRSDAKLPEILAHEQGHFDLCELYTRKLRKEISNVDMSAADVKIVLYRLYTDINAEYERMQQAYETETIHGTVADAQTRWQNKIADELSKG